MQWHLLIQKKQIDKNVFLMKLLEWILVLWNIFYVNQRKWVVDGSVFGICFKVQLYVFICWYAVHVFVVVYGHYVNECE